MDTAHDPRPSRARVIGRLFSVVWLAFLVSPTVDAFSAGTTRGNVLGCALLLFAGLYVALMRDMRRFFVLTPDPASRARWIAPALALLSVAITVGGGLPGLGTLPFLAVASVVVFARWSIVAILLIAGIAQLVSWSWTGSLSDPYGVAVGSLISGGAVWGFVLFMTRNQALLRAKDAEGRLALVAERDRFARDLHDILGHSLTVISVKAELAGRLLDAGSEAGSEAAVARARAEVADLERLARDALADVRRTVTGYRELTLPGELSRAREALVAAGIRPQLPNSTEAVDSDLRELFAWTVRESVTNIVRHSGATTCTVSLSAREVTVADDGRGPASTTGEGSGLTGMRERADALGAVVTAEAGMPRGFVLRVSAPAAGGQS